MDISNHKHISNLIWHDGSLLDLYSDGKKFFHYHWVDLIDELIEVWLIYSIPLSYSDGDKELSPTDLRWLILNASELAVCTSTTGEIMIDRIIKPEEVPEKWLPIP